MSISDEDWNELNALKKAINLYPASVHWDQMEKFTELLVKSWKVDEPENLIVEDKNEHINS